MNQQTHSLITKVYDKVKRILQVTHMVISYIFPVYLNILRMCVMSTFKKDYSNELTREC